MTYLALSVAALSYSILPSLIAPLLPTLGVQFGVDHREASWLITAYLISAAVATPVGGKLGDLYGRPRVLRITLVVLTVGGALTVLAPSFEWLLVARFVQGLGGCIFPLAFGVIRDQFRSHKVAGAIGLTSSIVALGAGLGILIVGPVEAALGYRGVFALPALMALVATVLAFTVVPSRSSIDPSGGISWWSAVFLAGALTTLLVLVTELPAWGWSWPTAATGAGFAAFAVAWVITERRATAPLIDLDLLTRPGLIAVNVLSFLGGWYLFASLTLLPQFLQAPRTEGGLAASIIGSSLLQAPQTLMLFLAGLAAGWINRSVGGRRSMIASSIGIATACALLAFVPLHAWLVLVAGVLSGLGIGALFAVVPNVVISQVEAHRTGIASGVNLTARNVGGAVGAQLTALVFAAAEAHDPRWGYPAALISLAVIGVLSLFASLFLPRRALSARDAR